MRSFAEVFGCAARHLALAPGRVNLLGEHTDYNEGYVLPTALPRFTRVELAPSMDGCFHFYSADLDQRARWQPGGATPEGFGRYVAGCIQVLVERGYPVTPVLLRIASEVPIGSGLSSSAALEVAVLRALRGHFTLALDDVELAKLAQRAEIDFAGVNCGILDQMACSLAQAGFMLWLDTRTLQRTLLPLPTGDLVVIDSGVARSLAAGGYNQRRSECEMAARLLGVAALRDVSRVEALRGLPPLLERRARHVITENARVLEAAHGVSSLRFGELMNSSHGSLRDDYEVSVEALDRLVALLQEHPYVYGARLTGAGFGGACVALVHPGHAQSVGEEVTAAYARAGYCGKVLI